MWHQRKSITWAKEVYKCIWYGCVWVCMCFCTDALGVFSGCFVSHQWKTLSTTVSTCAHLYLLRVAQRGFLQHRGISWCDCRKGSEVCLATLKGVISKETFQLFQVIQILVSYKVLITNWKVFFLRWKSLRSLRRNSMVCGAPDRYWNCVKTTGYALSFWEKACILLWDV